MANTLTKDDFNIALCDVRKAHRLIYEYQRKMLDLTFLINERLGFHDYGGNMLFCNCNPISTSRYPYYNLNIWNDTCAWSFLNSYVFEYYFGNKNDTPNIQMSIVQVSDTGYFDNDTDKSHELSTFASEEKSVSKLIFVVEKKDRRKKFAWNDGNWIKEKVYKNQKIMSKNHEKDCLNDKGNIQVIYSFSLDRFLNEETTFAALYEFVKYCNENGIEELKLL